MSLDKLSSLKRSATPAAKRPGSRRVPAALLPIALLVAFLALFGFLFGGRLIPALKVRVAPVITLRAAQEAAPSAQTEETTLTTITPRAVASGSLLFQASGWVEPDPYIIGVPTLIDGVVDTVHVLEGQSVKKEQLLATLIEDDALLDLEEAKRKVDTLNARQIAHCAELPVLNAQMHAADKKIAAEQAFQDELADAARRLSSVPRGSVPELDVRKAQLQFERQQAVVEEAKAELPRLLAAINKVDFERIAVDALIREAETALARQQLAFDRTRIVSPMDGIVLHLHATPGKKRMLGMDDQKSALIVELYDPAKLQARIDVPLAEAAGLGIGQPVQLTTDLLPDAKFQGEVTRVVGEADLQRNTLQAKVRILNPDPRLRPEMLVRAEFFPPPKTTAANSDPSAPAPTTGGRLTLYAAKEALFEISGNSAKAWIVDDNRARLREVTLGSGERDGHLLVRDGLRPGDKLILPPHHKLKDGKRIKVTN